MKKRRNYPIDMMARLLKVSRSGLYQWLDKKPYRRQLEDQRLKPLIKEAHEKSRRTSGTTKIQKDLNEQGVIIGRDRIARLKREMGLNVSRRRDLRQRPILSIIISLPPISWSRTLT